MRRRSRLTLREADKELFKSDPKPGGSVKTTLDVKTQNAADAALAGEARRSSLVAIRISDGAVLAVAHGPGGGDLDLALAAQVSSGGLPAEQAAAALGQGTTQVSPIALAGAAAAVARGQWTQPSRVLEPAPAKVARPGPQLNAGAVAALKAMMREVVTQCHSA